tara:strand:+ start:8 stop:1180 length:1173 start_codon:yes stop_codon:yes gene_type:complete
MIKFSAVGDIALFGRYNEIINNNGFEFPFSLIAPHLSNRDIIFGNLECPLSDKGKPDNSKPISLCGSPKAINALDHCGITHVSLANNHIYDYGELAAIDTQNRLTNAGIHYCGAGKNLSESRKPIIKETSGMSLAILAYSAYTTNGRKIASKNSQGFAPLNYNYLKEDIGLIKKKNSNCKIILSFHWGVEMNQYPTPFQQKLARRIIDDGADIIIGHHPHVVQGIERYNNGLIVYSLGNFCFPNVESPHFKGIGYNQKSINRESFIFDCDLSNSGIQNYSIRPFIINDTLQPELANGANKIRINKLVESLSIPLNKENYPNYYKEKNNKPLKSKNKLYTIIYNEGISGLIKRFNLMYIKAHLIALLNKIKEKKHRKNFYKQYIFIKNKIN